MSNEVLTVQQEKFVQELLKGESQRKAYRTAYPHSKKWKDNSVDVQASNLFKTPKINLRFKELQSRIKKEVEDEGIVKVKDIIKELAKIGFADIGNYLEYKTDKGIIGYDSDGEPIIDFRQVVDVYESENVDTSSIQEISIGKDGTFKFKLYDKQKALVDIGRHLGMFIDKVEHSGEMTQTIKNEPDLSNLSVKELKDLESILEKAGDSKTESD